MLKLSKTIMVLAFVAVLSFSPSSAKAQGDGGIDGYRVAAISAGIVGGVVVATIVTDGLIIPVYAWVSGGAGQMMGAVAGAGAGPVVAVPAAAPAAGAAAAADVGMGLGIRQAMGPIGQMIPAASQGVQTMGLTGYRVLINTMRVVGAVSGGLLADSWYAGG